MWTGAQARRDKRVWYLLPGERVTEELAEYLLPADDGQWDVVAPFVDPIWEPLLAQPMLPLLYYAHKGTLGAGARLVAWDVRGIGWTQAANCR